MVARLHKERTGYPTQKPVALLERIILASSNPGDLIADFFCGSGTTPFVASKHNRRFVACDRTFRALHTTRNRLTDLLAAFSLERDAAIPVPVSPTPKSVKIEVSADSICLKTKLQLDYWEVDPDWDGLLFKSAGQAKRGVRSDELPREIKMKAGRRLCIRLVAADGEQYQLNV